MGVQEVLLAVVMLVLGFVFLIKGADFFVEGSSAIARKFRVPPLIIGMTIVAMGTSLPELSVSVSASIKGSNALAVSNAVGSNLFNLMVVLGASAVISKMSVTNDVLRRDFPFSIFCEALLLGLGIIEMKISRTDGGILLVIFVIFLFIMVKTAMSARKESLQAESVNGASGLNDETTGENPEDIPILKNILFIIGGAVAIKFGGDWVVSGATTIALAIGISENLVGLTIVACGTSLPELVTSMVAAKKNELDMAVGNVVGSNIFNVLMILGVAAVFSPITFITQNIVDIAVLLVFSVLAWFFCLTRKCLERKEGIVMLLLYVVYLVYICVRK